MDQTPSAAEFDEQALVELRSDLGDAFDGFVKQFITTAQSELIQIGESLASADRHGAMEAIQAKAHSLRGTAGYIGAITFASALEALEHAAQHDEGLDTVRIHAASAHDAFDKVRERLRLHL